MLFISGSSFELPPGKREKAKTSRSAFKCVLNSSSDQIIVYERLDLNHFTILILIISVCK